jgi:hypothetical protein
VKKNSTLTPDDLYERRRALHREVGLRPTTPAGVLAGLGLGGRPWTPLLRQYAAILLAELTGRECGWRDEPFRVLSLGLVHSSARENLWPDHPDPWRLQ